MCQQFAAAGQICSKIDLGLEHRFELTRVQPVSQFDRKLHILVAMPVHILMVGRNRQSLVFCLVHCNVGMLNQQLGRHAVIGKYRNPDTRTHLQRVAVYFKRRFDCAGQLHCNIFGNDAFRALDNRTEFITTDS